MRYVGDGGPTQVHVCLISISYPHCLTIMFYNIFNSFAHKSKFHSKAFSTYRASWSLWLLSSGFLTSLWILTPPASFQNILAYATGSRVCFYGLLSKWDSIQSHWKPRGWRWCGRNSFLQVIWAWLFSCPQLCLVFSTILSPDPAPVPCIECVPYPVLDSPSAQFAPQHFSPHWLQMRRFCTVYAAFVMFLLLCYPDLFIIAL